MNPRHSSNTCEWYTPLYIVEAAKLAMGSIDLDPASCELAQAHIKAALWYGHNGLSDDSCPWAGNVFLNPPGGRAPVGYGTRSNAVLWWRHLVNRYREGHVKQAVFIAFSIEILATA